MKNGKYYPDRYEDKEGGDNYSDVYSIRNGLISITPLKMTSFDKNLYLELDKKIKA